ncbi:hypothetical protein [Dactylosporangium salmoneum]|uniref:hypothetical protein n=1 Tax=Dactylosporangium salmoneum TaxID=53361 RepID=UPI0031DF8914
MPRLRLALAQTGPSPAVESWAARAAAQGAELVVFPRLDLPIDAVAERLAGRGPAVLVGDRAGSVALLRHGAPVPCDVDGSFAAVAEGLLVHVGAEPFEVRADDDRLERLSRVAAESGAVVAGVNLVGGRDGVVFDGDSLVVRPDGALIARAPQFVERLLVLDLPGSGEIAPRLSDEAAAWQALEVGLRDRARAHGSVVLPLTGRLDAAVAAVVACDALGPANVVGVAARADDGRELALRTGLDFRVEPIQPMVDSFLANLTLGGAALGRLPDRVRGVVLGSLADQEGRLSGHDPLGGVPSALVARLARWRNEEAERRGEEAPIPPYLM